MTCRRADMKLIGKRITATVLGILVITAGYWVMRGSSHWILDYSTETDNGVVTIYLDSSPTQKTKVIFPKAQEFPTGQVILKTPTQSLPRGKIMSADTTILPGRVLIEIDGHRLDIMSRAIITNGIEYPWTPATTIELPARQ